MTEHNHEYIIETAVDTVVHGMRAHVNEIDNLIQTNIHTHTAKAAAKLALEAKQKEDREKLAEELEEKKALEAAQPKKSTAVDRP